MPNGNFLGEPYYRTAYERATEMIPEETAKRQALLRRQYKQRGLYTTGALLAGEREIGRESEERKRRVALDIGLRQSETQFQQLEREKQRAWQAGQYGLARAFQREQNELSRALQREMAAYQRESMIAQAKAAKPAWWETGLNVLGKGLGTYIGTIAGAKGG